MHTTQLRFEHISGMMLGVAVGDALGFSRQGLTRRQAIKRFGAGHCTYSTGVGCGLTGFNTSQLLMTAQALVSSGTEVEQFGKLFSRRLSTYVWSLPSDMRPASLMVALKNYLTWFRAKPNEGSLSGEPLMRSMMVVLALNNTNLRTSDWLTHLVHRTHAHHTVVEGCLLLSAFTKMVIKARGKIEPLSMCEELAGNKWSEEYSSALRLLAQFFREGRRTSLVAAHFGWDRGIPNTVFPAVIMSIYCFLRKHDDFYAGLDTAIRLGGDTSTIGSVVGGLLGTHLGVRRIPTSLSKKLLDSGYGPTWIKAMAERLSHWPHGVDDLHDAPALPSHPIYLLGQNLARWALRPIKFTCQLPCKLTTTQPARNRRKLSSAHCG